MVLVYFIFNNPENFKVSLNSPLSIVGGTVEVSSLDLTVTVENTGNVALTCYPLSATPTVFDSALSKTQKIVPITGIKKAVWTSNKIDVAQFEGAPSPDRFQVTIRCFYNNGQGVIVYLLDKTSYIDLNIAPEGTGGGGTNVKFRTGSLSYITGLTSGTPIAYADNGCGTDLIKYGYDTKGGIVDTCDIYYGSVNKLIANVPHEAGFSLVTTYTDQGEGDGEISLYRDGTKLALCEDALLGRMGYYRYSTTRTQGSVELNSDSIDLSREIFC